jgi:hypothetical protein
LLRHAEKVWITLWRERWQQFWAFQRKNNGFAILQRYYERHLTATGKALLLWQTVSLSLGLVGTEVMIYVLMCTLAGLWISVVIVGLICRPQSWHLEQLQTPTMLAHQTQSVKMTVNHPHPKVLFRVQMEAYILPQMPRIGAEGLRLRSLSVHPQLRPQERLTVRIPWTPAHRGQYILRSLSLISLFPLQLMRWRRVKKMDYTFWVYPEITHPLPTQVPPALQTRGSQSAQAIARQQAEHLAGTRPWRSGDSPRLIHWAGFARTGQLTVKEFQQSRGERIGLLLGGGNTLRNTISEDFEDALSLMAGFLELVQQQTASDPVELSFLQLGSSIYQEQNEDQYWKLLTLAQPEPIPWQSIGEQWPQVNQVIYVGLDLPPDYSALQQQLQHHGIRLWAYVPSRLLGANTNLRAIPERQHRVRKGAM